MQQKGSWVPLKTTLHPSCKALESTVVQEELEALTRDHEGPALTCVT